MNVEAEIATIKEWMRNAEKAEDLAPALAALQNAITAFNGVVDGLAMNQSHTEEDIKDLVAGKKDLWVKVNRHTDKINDLEKEDAVVKVKLATAHKVMVWFSLIISVLGGLWSIFGR